MNTKKVVSALLLLFVVASVGTIVAKERGVWPGGSQEKAATTAVVPQPSEKVIAYYFHGNYRCPTCRKIEAFTREAIDTGFGEDQKKGRVELKVINVEEPGNERFVQDYQLANRSVVVARYEGDNQKDWKRLDEVWQLVGDKESFIRFVQDQTMALLKGTP